jgi:hypothetical protein
MMNVTTLLKKMQKELNKLLKMLRTRLPRQKVLRKALSILQDMQQESPLETNIVRVCPACDRYSQ